MGIGVGDAFSTIRLWPTSGSCLRYETECTSSFSIYPEEWRRRFTIRNVTVGAMSRYDAAALGFR